MITKPRIELIDDDLTPVTSAKVSLDLDKIKPMTYWSGNKTEFEKIEPKDENTIYQIIEDGNAKETYVYSQTTGVSTVSPQPISACSVSAGNPKIIATTSTTSAWQPINDESKFEAQCRIGYKANDFAEILYDVLQRRISSSITKSLTKKIFDKMTDNAKIREILKLTTVSPTSGCMLTTQEINDLAFIAREHTDLVPDNLFLHFLIALNNNKCFDAFQADQYLIEWANKND